MPSPVRIERVILQACTVVFISIVAVISGLAAGFFLLPMAVIVAAWLLFYWALRHQGLRNPLSPPDAGARGMWADGQPLDEGLEHLTQRRAARDDLRLHAEELEARRAHEDEERAEEQRHTDPRDFEGPPPINPFP